MCNWNKLTVSLLTYFCTTKKTQTSVADYFGVSYNCSWNASTLYFLFIKFMFTGKNVFLISKNIIMLHNEQTIQTCFIYNYTIYISESDERVPWTIFDTVVKRSHPILISTVGQAEGLSVNGRIPAKHQYTCIKGLQSDYFLPRDAAQKIWSFWNRHQFQNLRSNLNVLYPAF